MSLAVIEKARIAALAVLNGQSAVKEVVDKTPADEKAARHIGRTLSRMSQVCSSGKREIAMFTNELVKSLGATDKIAHIKDEYISNEGTSRNGYNNGSWTHKPFTCLVANRADMGVAKGSIVLSINHEQFVRYNAKVTARQTYYGEHNYRLATGEEINKFFAAMKANFELEGGKLSPTFTKEVEKIK